MILITGCNSKMGKSLINKLPYGKEKILCIDDEKPESLPHNADFQRVDILNREAVKEACKDITSVFHLKEAAWPEKMGRNVMKQINIEGTRNILQSLNTRDLEFFFFLSSYSVYGKIKDIPTSEEKEPKPFTPFGRDKLKVEKICTEFSAEHKIPLVIFRPSIVIGPGTKSPSILLMLYMALAMEDEKKYYMPGKGENRFQMVHPDDAAEAIVTAYKKMPLKRQIYNIGSKDVPAQHELIKGLKEKAGLKYNIISVKPYKLKLLSLFMRLIRSNFFTKDYMFFLNESMILDTKLIEDELGWHPGKDNNDIMLDTAEWYMKEKKID